jgi:SAM-dependent methyltransferase
MSSAFGFVQREDCPACGEGDPCRLFSEPLSCALWAAYLSEYYRQPVRLNGNYTVEECRRCRTMWQREVGNEPLLAAIYGEWVKPIPPSEDPLYAFDVANPLKSRDGHEILAAAAFLGKRPEEMTTLDYGMGWASWARVAKSLGCRSFGFDLAEERREHARSHGVETEIEGVEFDFINTEQLIEHVADPATMVGELAARLRPGGVLKISVPAQTGVRPALEKLKKGGEPVFAEIMPIFPLEHVNCFSAEGLLALAGKFGLEEARPDFRQRFAFLGRRGSLDWSNPKRAAKELVRPFWQWRNPANLYVWLRKQG